MSVRPSYGISSTQELESLANLRRNAISLSTYLSYQQVREQSKIVKSVLLHCFSPK